MSKFNFQNYQESISNKELHFGDFKPIQPGGFGASRKESKPFMSISKNGVRFNSVATPFITKYGRYVEFMLHGDFLVMRFFPEKTNASYALTVDKNGGGAQCGAKVLLGVLQNETDSINVHLYRYKFDVKHDGENIFYVELKKPYDKRK